MTEEHNQSDSSLALTTAWATTGAHRGPGGWSVVTTHRAMVTRPGYSGHSQATPPPPSHALFRLELVKFIITTLVLIKIVLNIQCEYTSSQHRKSLILNCFFGKFDDRISLSSLDLTARAGLLLSVDPDWDKIIENVRFCAGGS